MNQIKSTEKATRIKSISITFPTIQMNSFIAIVFLYNNCKTTQYHKRFNSKTVTIFVRKDVYIRYILRLLPIFLSLFVLSLGIILDTLIQDIFTPNHHIKQTD